MYFYECINFCDTFTPQFLSLEYSNCKVAKGKIRQKFQISFSKILPNKFTPRFCPKNQKFPKARITRPTRSQSSSVFKFVEPKCQTAFYQKCYIIRCIRVWKVVADELNLRINALDDFKQAMVEYYKTALSNYDCENPRTFNFKSVCLKCNKCRSLSQPVSYCLCILRILIFLNFLGQQ